MTCVTTFLTLEEYKHAELTNHVHIVLHSKDTTRPPRPTYIRAGVHIQLDEHRITFIVGRMTQNIINLDIMCGMWNSWLKTYVDKIISRNCISPKVQVIF